MREVYGELVRAAAAFSRTRHEARDLVQSVLLDAIERGVGDLSAPERRAWLYGALRRRGAFEARTAARARRREARWLEANPSRSEAGETAALPWRFSREFLDRLAPSLRTLATLASADLQPSEIRWVLRMTDTAFRKRLSKLRRAVHEASAVGITLVAEQSQAFTFGKQRAQLIAALRRHPGQAIASHDPDGHPLIFFAGGAHENARDGNSD